MQSRKMYVEPHPARNPIYKELKAAQEHLRKLVLSYDPENPAGSTRAEIDTAAGNVVRLERIAPLLQIEV